MATCSYSGELTRRHHLDALCERVGVPKRYRGDDAAVDSIVSFVVTRMASENMGYRMIDGLIKGGLGIVGLGEDRVRASMARLYPEAVARRRQLPIPLAAGCSSLISTHFKG